MINTSRRTSRLRKALPMAARVVWGAGVMAVLARAQLFGDLSPFAVAGFAAALGAGWNPAALMIGCALGCPWHEMGWMALTPVAGCAIVLGGWYALKVLGVTARMEKSDGRRNFASEDVLVAGLAGIGALLPPLALSGGAGYGVVTALASGVIALAVAPVLSGAVKLNRFRTYLLPDEKLSLAVGLAVGLLGLSRVGSGALAAPFAALFTLSCSYAGGAAGAAVGVLSGAALAFGTTNPMIGATMGLMGLIAGLVKPLGRGWAALAFVLTNIATLAFGTGDSMGTIGLVPAISVALLYGVMPEALLSRLSNWLIGDTATADPDRLAFQLRQATGKRVGALESVFQALADGYGKCAPAPDEQMLIAEMRHVLCAGCPGYAACWNGTSGRAGRLLCGLLGEALKGNGGALEDGALPAELGRVCRRAADVPKRLGPLLKQFETRRCAALTRRTAGETLAKHFGQGAKLLGGLRDGLDQPLMVDRALGCTARAALEKAGFQVGEVTALRGDAIEVIATRAESLWDDASALSAQHALSQALGLPMRAAFSGAQDEGTLRLVQSPRLSAVVGYASRPRVAGAPCGDSHLAAGLTGARVLLALSDGMGSGEKAAQESAETIKLIRRFLLAEVDDLVMLEAVNQLLLIRGGEEMYATADLCTLDLQAGEAQFLKLGACSSFIVRRGECLEVAGGRLPLGILDKVNPAPQAVKLRTGDMVVMVTDGIADSASEKETLWVKGELAQMGKLAPGALCARLIEAACARPAGIKDDMTVLAARISRAR
ncbi:MAG: SpoIIE family protein phosphatase [Clostridia bacterium]